MQGFPWWCLEHLGEDAKWAVEDIGAHLSNRTWLVTEKKSCAMRAAAQKYLVKQLQHGEEFARSNKAVITLERYIAEKGLGPRVVFVSEDHSVIIYEHIEQPLAIALESQTARVEKLAEALARIHQLTPETNRIGVRQQLEQYCHALAYYNEQEAERLREDIASYHDLFAQCEQQPQVFCHNDLSMDHVFLTPDLKIIDWEYAGYSHPGMDLAMTVVMNDLYDEEIACLLDSYNERAEHRVLREELPDWIRVVALINRVWFKLQEAVTQEATADEENPVDELLA
ncbi:hypothetical protein CWE15_08515 [Aliidiomarina taiwanensis]|uniref:Aminoglycoside phosphotransferase domain-containing protein n=1 Tax=Aliidiomarina taiwanensis TaxID=946228 RepID=A0A432X0W6_9GAMM|nr:phosphotransferase [Aliidiomarina taiwanensis]RUO39792.1 hypothetical protein CWE15_08515 [Aliidiomarina taiwanensis]